jgi:hypothetical protein
LILYGTPEVLADENDTVLARALAYVKQAYAALSADILDTIIDVCAYERQAYSEAEINNLRKGLGRLALTWGMATTETCCLRNDGRSETR